MSKTFTDLTPEGKKFFQALKKLESLEIAVGFQRGTESDDGVDVVDYAAYNELGTSSIPARPFLKQSFENHEPQLKVACEKVNTTLSRGGTCELAMNELGVFLKELIQREITEGDFEPNSELTILRKGGKDTPLIDSGLMRESVNYVIRKESGG